MTALSFVLTVIALLLFVIEMASFAAMVKGCLVLRRLARRTPGIDLTILLKSPLVPAVSVVVVPPDSSPQSRDFVRRLLSLQFGSLEVVVSVARQSGTDLSAWVQDFHLSHPATAGGSYESPDPLGLKLVDAGTTGALNAGINAATAPVVALVHPDCEFDSNLLLNLIRPMLADPERTVAVVGLIPPPPATGFMAHFGALESLRTWLARGAAFAGWNLLLPVPGASMLVRRDAIRKAGGFRDGPLELFLDLHALSRAGGNTRIAFVPDSASYAPVPRSWADLFAQSSMDQAQIGHAVRHRGTSGLWAIGWGLPALIVVRWVRPLLETAALAGVAAGLIVGQAGLKLAALVLLCTAGTGILVSMSAVVLRELATFRGSDPTALAARFFAAIPENLGYRQVRNLFLISGFFKSP